MSEINKTPSKFKRYLINATAVTSVALPLFALGVVVVSVLPFDWAKESSAELRKSVKKLVSGEKDSQEEIRELPFDVRTLVKENVAAIKMFSEEFSLKYKEALRKGNDGDRILFDYDHLVIDKGILSPLTQTNVNAIQNRNFHETEISIPDNKRVRDLFKKNGLDVAGFVERTKPTDNIYVEALKGKINIYNFGHELPGMNEVEIVRMPDGYKKNPIYFIRDKERNKNIVCITTNMLNKDEEFPQWSEKVIEAWKKYVKKNRHQFTRSVSSVMKIESANSINIARLAYENKNNNLKFKKVLLNNKFIMS